MIVTGTIVIKMNGKSLRCKEGAGELDFGGYEREAVIADGEVIGPTQKPAPAKVKGTFVHTNDTDMAELADARDVTILFITDTGPKYTVRNAFSTKPPVLKAGGEIDHEFAGKPAVKSG